MSRLFSILCFTLLGLSPALAQDWPKARSVHIVVGFGPGATTDLVARLVAPKLSEAIGQSLLAMSQLGITISSLGLGALAEPAATSPRSR